MGKDFGARLKRLRENTNFRQEDAAKRLGVARSTYAKYETGDSDPDHEMLAKLANLYEVTTDYLITGDKSAYKKVENSNVPTTDKGGQHALTPKDDRDIARDLEKIMDDLETDDGLSFYGEEVEFDEEAKELLRSSLEQSMRLAKAMAKKKFTPKKYRNP